MRESTWLLDPAERPALLARLRFPLSGVPGRVEALLDITLPPMDPRIDPALLLLISSVAKARCRPLSVSCSSLSVGARKGAGDFDRLAGTVTGVGE